MIYFEITSSTLNKNELRIQNVFIHLFLYTGRAYQIMEYGHREELNYIQCKNYVCLTLII